MGPKNINFIMCWALCRIRVLVISPDFHSGDYGFDSRMRYEIRLRGVAPGVDRAIRYVVFGMHG